MWIWAAAAAVSGWYLLGVSITVGVVVYPSFDRVGPAQWAGFHAAHTRAITVVVGPGWVVEGLATAGWLVAVLTRSPVGAAAVTLALVHAVAAAGPVALTVGAAVGVHRQLGAPGLDVPGRSVLVRRLLVVDHLRSCAWALAALSASAGLLLASRG